MEPEKRSEIEENPTPLTSAKMLDSSGSMDKDTINIKSLPSSSQDTWLQSSPREQAGLKGEDPQWHSRINKKARNSN